MEELRNTTECLGDEKSLSGNDLKMAPTKYKLVTVVSIATGYGLDDRGVGVRVPVGTRIFTSSCHPDRLLDSHSILSEVPRKQQCGQKKN
jgi:hypothetical protein